MKYELLFYGVINFGLFYEPSVLWLYNAQGKRLLRILMMSFNSFPGQDSYWLTVCSELSTTYSSSVAKIRSKSNSIFQNKRNEILEFKAISYGICDRCKWFFKLYILQIINSDCFGLDYMCKNFGYLYAFLLFIDFIN